MSTLGRDDNNQVVQAGKQGAVQNVSYTAAAARSTVLGAKTSLVRLVSTTDCYFLVGGSTVTGTTANGSLLSAGSTEYIQVNPGQYISAIRSTADGSLNITEVA